MWARVQGAWKAVVAAVTPLIVLAVDNIVLELQATALTIGTAVVTALMVYFVPNRG